MNKITYFIYLLMVSFFIWYIYPEWSGEVVSIVISLLLIYFVRYVFFVINKRIITKLSSSTFKQPPAELEKGGDFFITLGAILFGATLGFDFQMNFLNIDVLLMTNSKMYFLSVVFVVSSYFLYFIWAFHSYLIELKNKLTQ